MKSVFTIIILFVMLMLTGANYKTKGAQKIVKHCKGYTVIEVDKGVDCNGDTIRLVKRYGFFERAAEN